MGAELLPDDHLTRALAIMRRFVASCRNGQDEAALDAWLQAVEAVEMGLGHAQQAMRARPGLASYRVIETIKSPDPSAVMEDNIRQLIVERLMTAVVPPAAVAIHPMELHWMLRRLGGTVELTSFNGHQTGFMTLMTAGGPVRVVGSQLCGDYDIQVLG